MNTKEIKLLEENGWTVECESPFEIRYKDGSFATGEAATLVLLFLKSNVSPKYLSSLADIDEKWRGR